MRSNGYQYDFDERYSFRNFTGQDLSSREDMDGLAICGSCFSQEVPDAPTLPPKLTGATFVRCNLDNVKVPDGNTVIDCTTRRFRAQNDGNDWLLDANGDPEKPVNWKLFVKRGLPIPSPADIPAQKVAEPVDLLGAALEARG